RDDRGADALDSARGDEHAGAVRETAGERRGSEEDETADEDDASPDQVGHAPTEEQEAAERDRVGGERPLHGRFGDVQVLLDRRDRDRHDRDVQDGHEERRPYDGENEPAVPGFRLGHLLQPSLLGFTSAPRLSNRAAPAPSNRGKTDTLSARIGVDR